MRVTLLSVCWALWIASACAQQTAYTLRQSTNVTVSDVSVTLRAGDAVNVVALTQERAMIKVPLPNGQAGSCFIPLSLLQKVEIAPVSPVPPSPARASSPAPAASPPPTMPPPLAKAESVTRPGPAVPPVEGEDTVLKIECTYRFRKGETSVLGPTTEDEDPKNAPEEGTYHYRLYLPPGYKANPAARYPVLFIASPNGNASVGNFQERARRDRWLVVALVESKNDSPLWLGNFLGAYDDVIARARVIGDMKFATGMSGGSRCASTYALFRPGFRGLILQAAGFYWDKSGYRYDSVKKNRDLLVYGLFGNRDQLNFKEVARTQEALPSDTVCQMEVWSGKHQWAPAESLERGVDWMERKIFLENRMALSADACSWYCHKRLRLLESAKRPMERYELIESVLTVAARWTDAELKGRLLALQTEATELARNTELQGELAARTAFFSAAAADSRHYMRTATTAGQVVGSYEQVAQRYPGTVYAGKATARAASIKMEYKLD